MLPNFLIVGAAKAGSTSLWHYLNQHSEIFLSPNKEPNFFVFENCDVPPYDGPTSPDNLRRQLYPTTITDIESYEKIFQAVRNERAVGEASVRYLYFPRATYNISHYIPKAKIIIMLRNPVKRLYSHYLMMRGVYCLESLELEQAVQQEEKRIAQGWGWDWHYTQVSLYFKQVKRYFDVFGAEQVRVYFSEDFRTRPVETVQDVCRFLNVDSTFRPNTSKRQNQAYWPRNERLNQLVRTPNGVSKLIWDYVPQKIPIMLTKPILKLNQRQPPQLPSDTIRKLQGIFKQDMADLEALLERKLPW